MACERSILRRRTGWVLAGMLLASACAPKPKPAESVIEARIRNSQRERTSAAGLAEGGRLAPSQAGLAPRDDPAIAVVNGSTLSQRQLVDLLWQSHGVGVLEQLIGLETARKHAEERELTITETDVRNERTATLRKLSPNPGERNAAALDQESAERSLEAVMAARNVSAAEFELLLRRNAYLRKLAEAELVISDADLNEELERAYGERAEVRHIQLATPAEVDRVLERLSTGETFEELARSYSANQLTAARGGLLEPFSRHDEEWPDALRQAAFSLEPGSVSHAVRVAPWYHLLRLERRIPAERRDRTAVRSELERRIRERRTEPAMFALYEKLFRAATIEIRDPALKAAFEKRHPARSVE